MSQRLAQTAHSNMKWCMSGTSTWQAVETWNGWLDVAARHPGAPRIAAVVHCAFQPGVLWPSVVVNADHDSAHGPFPEARSRHGGRTRGAGRRDGWRGVRPTGRLAPRSRLQLCAGTGHLRLAAHCSVRRPSDDGPFTSTVTNSMKRKSLVRNTLVPASLVLFATASSAAEPAAASDSLLAVSNSRGRSENARRTRRAGFHPDRTYLQAIDRDRQSSRHEGPRSNPG